MAAAAATVVIRNRGSAYKPQYRAPLDRAEVNRVMAEVRKAEKRRQMQKLLAKYDADKTGKLNKDQMLKLLTDMENSTPKGKPPTEEELDYIIQSTDISGSWLGFSDGEIDADELESACLAWATYSSCRKQLEDVFAKFDHDKSGHLTREELKNYLVSLNGSMEVTDDEVNWVFNMADLSQTGVLNKPEVMRATVEWYTYVNAGKKSATLNQRKCCSVS